MASWKKIIVSGSDAELNSLYSSGNISSSGSLFLPRAGSSVEIYNTVFEDDGGAFSINTNSTPELNLVSPLIILDNSGPGGNDFVVTGSNVGIGTATPSDKVHISNGRLRVSDTVLNNGTTNLTFEPEAPTHGQTYTVNVIAEDSGKPLIGDVTANIYIPYFGNQTADIVLTKGDQIISGSKTFADNVLIAGNLIKKGTEAGAGETAIQFTTNSTTGDGEIAFETSGSEVLRIDKSGNIGIGVATPLNALDVSGSISASGTMFSLTVDTTEVSSSVVSSSLYLGTDFGNRDGSSNFTGSFSGDGSGLTGIASTLTFSDESDTSSTVALKTQTLKITGGEGIDTTASGQTLTISGEDATTTNKGIASFSTTNFTVSSGAVSSKNFTITSGNGLTGGGALTLGGSTTLNVDSGSMLPYYSSSIFGTVSGDITIDSAGVATIANDAVELGTDTTGDYVANLGTLTGLTTTGNSGESATPTLAVDYGSIANTAVQGNTTITVNGTENEIQVTGTAAQALGGAPSYTIGLPNDVTIGNNLTVTGDLTVNGTTTTLDTQNVLVEDRFIFLNHGSGSISPTSEGGIVVEGTTADQGNAFYYDGNLGRWSLGEGVAEDAISVTPSASMAAVVDVDAGQSDTATYQKNGNIKVESGEIWIYA